MNIFWSMTKFGPRPIVKTAAAPTAFTLIELLVVMSIIGLLAGLMMPALGAAKEKAKRVSCKSNLHQLIIGSIMYANDDSYGQYSNTFTDADNNLNHLYPSYVPALASFICPSTHNKIRPDVACVNPITRDQEILDLTDTANDTRGTGASYEIFGFMNYTGTNETSFHFAGMDFSSPGIKKSLLTVDGYIHKSETYGLLGQRISPSDIWLILDNEPGENYPRSTSNHGTAGDNVSMCDGSVRWVRRSEYSHCYEVSQDEGREGP